MMQFRMVKAWLVAYLASHATAGKFRVVGYGDTDIDASRLRNPNRLVQVFAKSGDFPVKASAFTGPSAHDVSLTVELLTAASSSVDLSALSDPNATPGDIAAALAASQKAAQLADDDADEFVEVIYQLLMANDQQDLGYPGEVAGRWVSNWKKGSPLNRGENVILPCTIDFGFRVEEAFTGVDVLTPEPGEAVRVAINASADETGTPQEGSAVLAGG